MQRIADLSNHILAQIVDLTCNLVRILDCDFTVELLADPNLDKTIFGWVENGVLAFENVVLAFEKVVLAFEN